MVASPFKSGDVAATHDVVGLTKAAALGVATMQITCNAVCPGYVRTPLVDGQIKDQDLSEDEVVPTCDLLKFAKRGASPVPGAVGRGGAPNC